MARRSIIKAIITGDAKQLMGALDEAERKLKSTGRKMTTHLSVPLAAAGVAAFKMASDLSEASSQAQQVFGADADKIASAARDLNDSFSETEFLQYASNIGDIAQGMGFARSAATDLSVDVLELAQDLGSFKNLPTERAVNAITSAMTGEREALKSLGIVINEEMVNQHALASGLAETTDEIDQQVKAQATFELITQRSANAIGDFDRTADGAANQTRILTANFKDTAAELGTGLLPVGQQVLEWANTAVSAFANLSEGQQKTILATGGIVAALGPLLSVTGNLVTVVKKLKDAQEKLNGTLGSATLALGAVGAAAMLAFSEWSKSVSETKQRTEDLVESMLELGRRVALNQQIRDLVDAYKPLRDAMRETGITTLDLTEALESGNGEWDTMVKVLAGAGGKGVLGFLTQLEEDTGRATEAIARQRTAGEEARREWGRFAGQTGPVSNGLGGIELAADGVTAATDEVTRSFNEMVNEFLGSIDVEAQTRVLLDDIAAAIQGIDEKTLGEAQTEVFNLSSELATLQEQAARTGTDGLEPMFQAAQLGILGITDNAELSNAQVQSLIDLFNHLNLITLSPKHLDLFINMSAADRALLQSYDWSRAGLPALAEGGIVTGPTIAMIGERGPEAVIPLDRLDQMGAPTVIRLEVDGRVLAEAVVAADRRTGGGLLAS